MGRVTGSKLLKRVDGDVYLAPVIFEEGRPITSGAPLRRCSNDTSLSLSPNEALSSATTTATVYSLRRRNSARERERKYTNKMKTCSEIICKTGRRSDATPSDSLSVDVDESRNSVVISSSIMTASEKYMVPTNTAIASTATRSTLLKPGESSESSRLDGNPYVMCIYDDSPSLHTYSSQLSVADADEDDDPNRKMNPEKLSRHWFNRNAIKASSHMTNSTSYTEQISYVEASPVELSMTTATSLTLPVSSRSVLPTRSDEWSLKNQVATATTTARSKTCNRPPTPFWESDADDASKSTLESCGNRHTEVQTSPVTSSKAGDGDAMIRTPPMDRYTNAVFLPVPPPPASPATSPSFPLTFNKPKRRQRPRSIVTNYSSSNKASLPSTASTPNPISPPVCTPDVLVNNVLVTTPRNNDIPKNTDNNNNNDGTGELNNNNDEVIVQEKNGGECSRKLKEEGNLPKSMLSLDKRAVKGKVNAEAIMGEITYQSNAVGHPPVTQHLAVPTAQTGRYSVEPPPYTARPAARYSSQPHSPQPHSPQPHSPQPHSPQPHSPQPHSHPHHSAAAAEYPTTSDPMDPFRDDPPQEHLLPNQGYDKMERPTDSIFEPDAAFWHSDSSPSDKAVVTPQKTHSNPSVAPNTDAGNSGHHHHDHHPHEHAHTHTGPNHPGVTRHGATHGHIHGHIHTHEHNGSNNPGATGHHTHTHTGSNKPEATRHTHAHAGSYQPEAARHAHRHTGSNQPEAPNHARRHTGSNQPEAAKQAHRHTGSNQAEAINHTREYTGSDKSASTKQTHTPTGSVSKTLTEERTEITTAVTPESESSYKEHSSSYSPYNKYPSEYTYGSGSGYSSGPGYKTSDAPFLRTEKGAIRFHLPGRIQHKTTIKVAHFPTNEDKNINLNIKGDKVEEDVCEEEPDPCCANNQNFIIPPPSAAYNPYNPYNPYGYGGCSPYSPESYYRYYGYPPPYC